MTFNPRNVAARWPRVLFACWIVTAGAAVQCDLAAENRDLLTDVRGLETQLRDARGWAEREDLRSAIQEKRDTATLLTVLRVGIVLATGLALLYAIRAAASPVRSGTSSPDR